MKHQMRWLLSGIIIATTAPLSPIFAASPVPATTIWNDDMSSLAAWQEESNAWNEDALNGGGIRVMLQPEREGGNFVQMNSWWDNAIYTYMSADTDIVIKDETEYTLIARMESYDNGHAVTIQLANVTDGWTVITEDRSPLPMHRYEDFSTSFSTIDGANSHLIGDTIGIAIVPGEWNNLAVTNVSIKAVDTFYITDSTSPGPNPMAWHNPPFARNETSLSMTAPLATDDLNGVEYFFECLTDPQFSSPWQESAHYTCFGLETGTEYSFRVKARDTSRQQNETDFSDPALAMPMPTSGYPKILPGTGGHLTSTDDTQLTVTIDVADQKQTIKGFGASDCWSAQYYGLWSGVKQAAIADLLFETSLDPENNPMGAGLSIWRTNLGAGSSRQNNIYDSWRHADMYLSFGRTKYDWARCSGQRNFLQQVKARGVDHFIAFCNSPPYSMTKNGMTFCDPTAVETNLDPAKREEFATYLVDVLEHFKAEEGIDFTSVSPFNEPEWAWEENPADPGHGWQEGCRYSNREMKAFAEVLQGQIQSHGLEVQISLWASGQINFLFEKGRIRGEHIYQFFDDASSNFMGDKLPATVTGHSYRTDTPDTGLIELRQVLRNELDLYNLDYDQTEYCIMGDQGNGRDLGIDPALHIARTVHFDMTIAEATSWQWWLGVSPFDYKDGLVYIDDDKTREVLYDSKMLWAVGNYARFVRPGMKRVQVSRSDLAAPEDTTEGLMVSSYYSPLFDVCVTVVVNRKSVPQTIQLNYQGLPEDRPFDQIVPYVTSSTDNLRAYAGLSVTEAISIPPQSIVTLVSQYMAKSEPDIGH
jgi:O-glycosyl hydrolase